MAEGMRESSCYIGQIDLLAEMITAGELMEFATTLKVPNTTPKQRTAIVVENLAKLGLDDCYNTRTERLSGGQRRRLSIAIELVNDPPVLFLDEPTSGLDNVSTGQMIRLLSQLARGGRTIVCTIHQPSASLFDLFDKVYFLAAGKCVYQGGAGGHLIDYLATHDFVCPIHYNPADFVIEVTEDFLSIQELSKASKNGKISWYGKESGSNKPQVLLKKQEGMKKKRFSKFKLFRDSRSHSHFWLQFWAIFYRLMLQSNRNKNGIYIQIFHHVGCSLIIGGLFYNCGNDGNDPFNLVKFYLTVIVFYTYTQSIITILQYPFERKLVKREYFNQWYSLFPYYAAYTVTKACYMLPLLLLFVPSVYALSGMPWELERFLLFLVVGILTSSTAESLGLVIGTLFNVTNGSIVGPMTLTPVFGFAIYGIDFSRAMGPLMNLLVRTSFMRSARTLLFLVGYGLGRERMDCSMESSHCIFNDPRVFIYYLNLDHVTLWNAIIDLSIHAFLYRIGFYLVLKWKMKS
ncbi:ATP-binding cassette subfamily G member 4 isoform X2 [Halyomorpha halys]|nr:ATP-binding cassette sub-family G member 4-like isoform X2 [Halyomorpha halys]